MKNIMKILIGIIVLLGIICFTPIVGKKRTNEWTSKFKEQESYDFPKKFYWGTAVASQQVEHQHNSDWTDFEKRVIREKKTQYDKVSHGPERGHIADHDKFSELMRTKKANFDEMYDKDFEKVKSMGHNSFRFSFSWSRLFPTENQKQADPNAVKFYKGVIKSLQDKEMTPFATIFHFSSPKWFWKEKNGKIGWERDDALEIFENYVKELLKHFGKDIQNWCTLNEPMVHVFNGYIEGYFPPNLRRKGPAEVTLVVERLLRAHAIAYKLIHEHGKKNNYKPMVGITKHTRAFEPLRNYAILDRLTADAIDQAFIWDFLDAIETGHLKISNTSTDKFIKELENTSDYVGINYYGRFYIKSDLSDIQNPKILFNDKKNDPTELTNDLGWAIYPKGFYDVLIEAHRRYKKPIFVLENGLADKEIDDKLRQIFIVTHLKEIWNAMKYGGVDIRGYMHWTLTDNFEWAESFNAKFGLFSIDFKKGFERTTRKSAKIYSKIIKQNAIDKDTWNKYSKKNINE